MRYFRIEYRRSRQKEAIVLESESKIDAIRRFQQMTLGVMLSVREVSKPLSLTIRQKIDELRSPLRNKRVVQEPYIASLRQIHVMLDAGMPINQCIEEAVRSTDNEMLRAILTSMLRDIESGVSLSDAVKPFKRQLGNLSLSMFHLGEQTGTLSESIAKLADILERILQNRRQLVKATRYPLFTITAMMIAFVVVIVMVVPQFQEVFSDSGAELPYPTQLLLWIEHAVTRYGPYILGGAVLLVMLFSHMYRKYPAVRLEADRWLLKVYIVGKVTHYAMIGRFIYIFNVLMHAGIPITDALDAAIGVVDNAYMRQRLASIRRAIEEGRPLFSGFEESGMFANMINQMVKAGEQGGALTTMLEKVTKYYQEKYQYLVDNVASMIEPILISAIAGFVLLLALGIFLPMWSMAEAMGM
ncbi:type II secretion system F family protein [Hydrogenimonas urashimensis]|uniref:type II secretion system F family protein n=1 Tax=Hydrogenimonas urashimensis TaxID=2740515 RepID=UPI001916AA6D|nr:type II secretion system F family protein [Hydrogenimonas urashimensis]